LPPLPPVANVIKCTDSYLLGAAARPAETILHWGYSGSAPSAAGLVTLAGLWQAQQAAQLKFLLNNNCQMTGTTLLDLSSSSGHQGASGTVTTGTLAGTETPASLCVVVQHQIARRYRGGKPRTYFPFGDGSKTNGADFWAAAFVTLVGTNFGNAVSAFTGAVGGGATITGLVSVSYYQGFTVVTSPTTGRSRNVPKLRSGGPVTDTIVANVVNSKYGTQRRRLKT